MMKKNEIIIFDMIGAHTGALYYDTAFYQQLKAKGYEVEIHSNFNVEGGKSFFEDIFVGGKIKKGIRLIKLLCLFALDVIKNRNKYYICISYGNFIDLLFLKLLVYLHPYPTVDIHEFISTDKEDDPSLKSKFIKTYGRIPLVIIHSQRSEYHLNEMGYKGKKLMVPHFKYCFNKSYDLNEIDIDVINAIRKDRINLLFFGNMRQSKGIDTVVESIKETPNSTLGKLNFIFAGIDTFGIVKQLVRDLDGKASFSVFLRYMTNEESNYLYDCSDVILLPYKEVSQSGVLEMAVYFRKTMLLSDIPYFKEFSSVYPSFAYLISRDSYMDLARFYSDIVDNGLKEYSPDDLKKFYQQEVFDEFFEELEECLDNR